MFSEKKINVKTLNFKQMEEISIFQSDFDANYLFGKSIVAFVSDGVIAKIPDEWIAVGMLNEFCKRFAGDALTFGEELKDCLYRSFFEYVENYRKNGDSATVFFTETVYDVIHVEIEINDKNELIFNVYADIKETPTVEKNGFGVGFDALKL